MRVVLLGPACVIHTQRWVDALASRDVELILVTQHADLEWHAPDGVRTVQLPFSGTLGYFLNIPFLRRVLQEEQPDLLNVHYASGYGSTAALAGFRPWMLSVWGSDVYDFPYESRLKGWWLRRNLASATAVASTSKAMAVQVRRLLPAINDVVVTPFGIDTKQFAPAPESHHGLIVGTVKKLEPKYGVDVLLVAFAKLLELAAANGRNPLISLEIVGGGGQLDELRALASALGIADRVRFVGAVAHAEVPKWLHRFDVYVAVSRLDSESFGVAVLEASACAVPVVVSDVGGLPEVVSNGETGLIVPREDPAALAAELNRLLEDVDLRRLLGNAGRARVERLYDWHTSVDQMLACYQSVIKRYHDARMIGR